MKTRTKALGAALAATLALSSAATASASELHSGSGSGTTYLTTAQIGTHQLDTEGGNIKWTTSGGSGSYAGTTTSSVKLYPTYSGCTAYGLTAHIDTMGCYYRLQGTFSPILPVTFVECPTTAGGVTDEITVSPTQGGKPVCTVEIPEQELGTWIFNSTFGTPDDVEVRPALSSLYRVTYSEGGGIKCGVVGTHSDGRYTGAHTLRAFSNSGHSAQVDLTYF